MDGHTAKTKVYTLFIITYNKPISITYYSVLLYLWELTAWSQLYYCHRSVWQVLVNNVTQCLPFMQTTRTHIYTP